MKRKISNEKAPKVHAELAGFNVSVNEFGEITTSLNVEKINEFLNKNVEDRKLVDREQ